MASLSPPQPSREKVRAYRERLRATLFRSEAHGQSLAVAQSAQATDDQGFIDAVSALDSEHNLSR
jgi:hypothetical protein